LLQDFPGVQDVFCGTETVIHIKRGAVAPSTEALTKALEDLKVACEGVVRDDSRML
jgi:hypothetical protein